jgi:hypothetical protein
VTVGAPYGGVPSDDAPSGDAPSDGALADDGDVRQDSLGAGGETDAPAEEATPEEPPAPPAATAPPMPAPQSAEPPPPPARKRDAVETAPADATAFAPKKVRRGTPELVRVAIHQPKDLKAVIKAARQIDPGATPAPQGMSIGDIAIGAHVGVSLEVRGAACGGL